MKILYHSAVPWTHTGYGRCTREIAPRLHNGEHEVAIQSMSAIDSGKINWHGDELSYELDEPMTIYPSENSSTRAPFGLGKVREHYDDFGADLYFTHFDTWMEPARKSIPNLEIPYMSYVIVDHYPVPDELIKQVSNAHHVISMSEYAQLQLSDAGINSDFIPHGVDEEKYFPLPKEFREGMSIQTKKDDGEIRNINVEENFIIGMVAANHADRKNIPAHMMAFKEFIDNYNSDAILYLHTQINSGNGYNLTRIKEDIGIPDENFVFTKPEDYGNVGDDFLNSLYNAFDVMLNCSFGESWGLTITEAQSAGTPCIVTNFSSMPEQLGFDPDEQEQYDQLEYPHRGYNDNVNIGPHGIAVDPVFGLYREKVSAKQFIVHPEDILDAIIQYWQNPQMREEHGEKAREHVVNNYTWDNHVVPKFEQIFGIMEDVLT